MVVDEQAVKSVDLPLSVQAKDFAETLLETTDVSQLLPNDFAVVREYLQRRSGMLSDAKNTVCMTLTQDIRERIRMDELPESISPDVFLEAVYLAYQKQVS